MPSTLFVGRHSSIATRPSHANFSIYLFFSCIALIADATHIPLVKGILPHVPERPSSFQEQLQTTLQPSQNDLWTLVESASSKNYGTIRDSSSEMDLAWHGFPNDPTAETRNKIFSQPHHAFEKSFENDFQLGRVGGDHARFISSEQNEPVSITSPQFLDSLSSSFYTDGNIPHYPWTGANHPYNDVMARISAVHGQSSGNPKAGNDYHGLLTSEFSLKSLPAESQVNTPFGLEKALPTPSRISSEGAISGILKSEDPHQLSALMEQLSGRHSLPDLHFIDRYSGSPVHTSARAQNQGRPSAYALQETEAHEALLNFDSFISSNVDENSRSGETYGRYDEKGTPNNLDSAEMNYHLTSTRHSPALFDNSNMNPLQGFSSEIQATHENGMGTLQAVNHYPVGDANLEYNGLDRWASGLLGKEATAKKITAGRITSLVTPGAPFETHLHASNLGYPLPDVEKGPTGTRLHFRKAMPKEHAYSPITGHAPFLKESTPSVRAPERNDGVPVTPETRIPANEDFFFAETSDAQTSDKSVNSGVFRALPSNREVIRKSVIKFPKRFQRLQEGPRGSELLESLREEYTSDPSGNIHPDIKRRKLNGKRTILIEDLMPWWCGTRKGETEMSKCLEPANPILAPAMLRFLDEAMGFAHKMPLADRSKISMLGRLQKNTYEFLQMQLEAQKYLEPNLENHEIQKLVKQGYEWLVGLWKNLDFHQFPARDSPTFHLEPHLEAKRTLETIALLQLRSEPTARLPRTFLGYLLYEWIQSQKKIWIPIIDSGNLDPKILHVNCRPFQLLLAQLKNFEKRSKKDLMLRSLQGVPVALYHS